MSSVTVVNLKNSSADFVCDRTSPLGNPFVLEHEIQRAFVISQYNIYFHTNLNPDYAPEGFLEYLDKILQEAKVRPITLGCWCAPKKCHCDIIKNYVELTNDTLHARTG